MDDILLIDDDVELCSMLTEYMGRYGFRVTAVHRGDTGLKAALEKPFALVLLDVMLPGMDGFEVLRRIRAASAISVLLLDGARRRRGPHCGAGDRRRRLPFETI